MSDEIADHPLFTQACVGKQADFHASPADARWCIAGNQSGKTTAGAREAAWFVLGLHPIRSDIPVPNIGWIITLDRTFVEEVLMPAMLYWLPKQYIRKIQRGDSIQIHLTNGSRIVFRTYGQGWLKFQGAKINWAWFDEECPSAVYDETMVRLMAYQGPHWVTMTPLQGKTWVYQRIVQGRSEFKASELAMFSWSTLDNTSLDKDRVETTFRRMPVEIRAARMRGDFVDLEGLVFPQFDERVHMVDDFKIPAHWPVVVGMDYGYRHPFAAVFLAVDETGRIVVWHVYRQQERLMKQHAGQILKVFLHHAPHLVDVNAAERVLRAVEEGRTPVERPFIRARFVIDSSAQLAREELRPFGIAADNCEKRQIIPRIERVGSLFLDALEGRPGIAFMRGRCGPLIDELRGYSWKKRPAVSRDDKAAPPEPQDIHDDAVDALGYGVLAVPGAATPLTVKPPENSPAYMRDLREKARRISQRMGNERASPDAVHAHLAGRLARVW